MEKRPRATLPLAASLTLGVLAGLIAPAIAMSVTAAPPMSDEFTISARSSEQYEIAIAYNWKHQEYLVVWQDGVGGTGIYGQRVTALGRLVGPSPIHIAEGGLPRREPAVDYDPVNDRYLVVWMHDRTGSGGWNLSGRFIPWETSTPALPEFSITNWVGAVWHPEVAYSRGKQEFLVVAVHHLGGGAQPYIAGKRIYADGSGIHPNLLIISSGTEPCDLPDVAYSGTTRNEYLVTWDEWTGANYDVYAIRLDNNGNSLGGGEFVVANSGADDGYPAVAACNSCGVNGQYMVVWETVNWLGHDEIRRRFVSGTGVLDWDYQVDTTLGKEDLVDVACSDADQQYLIVWQLKEQYVNSKFGILGTRVDTFGSVLDVPAFEIVSPGLAVADRYNPAVAAGPAPGFLVAWERVRQGSTNQDVYGRLVGLEIRNLFLPLILRNYK